MFSYFPGRLMAIHLRHGDIHQNDVVGEFYRRPDGFQAMCEGSPFIRSSLRPPQPGTVRSGLDPCDVDGDGIVRWMRWKHPAGSFVPDPDVPMFMRPRTLEDDPADAYFLCDEGEFIRVDDVEGFRFRVESSIRPVASALGGGDPEILALLDSLLAEVINDEMIEGLAADRWSSLVDKWAGTDWEIGQVFTW